jgi:tetratricopeptide (TPR) repeat protein
MNIQVKQERATADSGVEMLFQGDFRHLKREIDQRIWPGGMTEDSPGPSITTSFPDWVTVEVENGYLRVDRSKFTPVQAAYYRASQFMSQENWLKALEAFVEVIKLDPGPTLKQSVLVMIGMTYLRMEQFDEAARTFEESISLNDQNSFAHLFLGTARMLSGKFDDAITPLKSTLELNPSNTNAYFYLGYVYENLGQWEKAIASYNAEIENHGTFTGTYERLAKLYYKLGEDNPAERNHYYIKTIEVYKKWADLEPANSAVRNLIGYLYSQIGNLVEARDAFAEAVNAKHDNVIALSNLGIAYLNADQNQAAKQIFERIIDLGKDTVKEQLSSTSPDDLEEAVRKAMGETYQLLGAATLRLYQSVVQENAEKPDRLLLADSENAFKTALSYEPSDIHSLYNLGVIYYMSRRLAAAIRQFSAVLEIAPSHEDAGNNLRHSKEELAKIQHWLGSKLYRRLQQSSEQSPVFSEDLVEELAEGLSTIYQDFEVATKDDVFTANDLFESLLPLMESITSTAAQADVAGRIVSRGWLSPVQGARLIGADLTSFLGYMHTTGASLAELTAGKGTEYSDPAIAALKVVLDIHPNDNRTRHQLELLLSRRLDENLNQQGILQEVKKPITDFTPYRQRTQIQVKGTPVSETLVEDRQ